MDIKKPDSPLFSGGTPSVSRQTSASQNQTHSQLNTVNIKLDNIGQIKIGQQIELLVVKITLSEAFLDIVGTPLRVHTTDKDLLHLGQQLKARIIATKPILQLEILDRSSNVASTINSTLRQTMPMQQSLKGLLETVQMLSLQHHEKYSAALHTAVSRFLQSMPPLEAYQEAAILPEILKRSGLFSEQLLARHLEKTTQRSPFPNNDLKISLLRLAEQLTSLRDETTDKNLFKERLPLTEHRFANKNTTLPSPHQGVTKNTHETKQNSLDTKAALPTQEKFIEKLLTQTEAVLARLQTLQLQQLQPEEQHKPAWSFELPVRTNTTLDNLQIYIEQDSESTQNKNYLIPWKVILKFNIKELGAIQAHITLQGSKVSVNFWTENKKTSTLFSDHLNLLQKQLDQAGLETGQLNCRCDEPPAHSFQSSTSLIDETI